MSDKHKTILLVDDDLDIVKIVEKKLTQDNFHVLTAMSGEEAIKKAKETPPDLILMDIVLPDVDGSETVKRLRDSGTSSDVPIIFLSGIVANDEKGSKTSEVTVDGEVFEAIGKPFSYNKLLEEINKNLS